MGNGSRDRNSDIEVSFSRDLGLFDATMIGVGAMIGAGIFVLTGIAAGVAGPAALLAFGLNALVTLLTALSYAELASAYPRSGGGYSYITQAFPGPVGFVSGWMLWFCYIIACSLYALGFASYFWEFIHSYLPSLHGLAFEALGGELPFSVVTVAIGLTFIAINVRGTAVSGNVENILTMAKIVILAIFILFGLKQIFSEPAQALSGFSPFFPRGFSGVILAMGLTFIAFEGYDLIATVAEEIKDPERNIPRATVLSLSITIVTYLLIVIVCLGAIKPDTGAAWEFLGRYQETAIVRAAENFMPFFGVALIVFGGLLSTLSALNATILASSRVAFSMGRDKMLPGSLSSIHRFYRTPHVAIAITGVIMLTMSLLFPIHVIGSAASLMFLLTFALVNLALIALRRKFPEVSRGFRVPLYPVTPIAGVILNLFLAVYQFEFDPRSWYIAVVWVVVGLLVYFMYFEKKVAPEMPQVLEVGQTQPGAARPYRILLPLHNPDHVIPLMKLAVPIARDKQAEIIVLGVVPVSQNLPIHEGMRFIHHKAPLLKAGVQYGKDQGVPTRSIMRIAHRVYDGITHAAEAENASLVLMGWKGYTTKRDRIFGEIADQVVHHVPCDLIAVKLRGDLNLERILVPTAGGPHATLAAEFAAVYHRQCNTKVTGCYVVDPSAGEREREKACQWISKTVHLTAVAGAVRVRLIESKQVASGLIKAGAGYDLIAIGASREGIFSSVLFGEIPEKVARFSDTPVMMVKRYEGAVKSLVKKILG